MRLQNYRNTIYAQSSEIVMCQAVMSNGASLEMPSADVLDRFWQARHLGTMHIVRPYTRDAGRTMHKMN